jgi:predicted transcriptional regulator
MLKEKSTMLPVIESEESPALRGIVSLLDVFKNLDMEKMPDKDVSMIMSTKVVTASPDDPITRVWDKMVEEDFTGLPVMKDGRLIGMITRFDILKRGWARISKESETRPVDSTQMPVQKLMSHRNDDEVRCGQNVCGGRRKARGNSGQIRPDQKLPG